MKKYIENNRDDNVENNKVSKIYNRNYLGKYLKKYLKYLAFFSLKNISTYIRYVIDFFKNIHMDTCAFCKAIGKEYVCNNCRGEIISFIKIEEINMCIRNERLKIYSLSNYTTLKKHIIKAKFLNRPTIFNSIIYMIKNDIIELFKLNYWNKYNTCVVFVGMNKKKKDVRGYNQSEIIAKSISHITGISVLDVIEEKEGFKKQSSLNKEERRQNVENRYAIKGNECIEKLKTYENIIIIDDIFTTGETILAINKLIKKEGIKANLYNIVLSSN